MSIVVHNLIEMEPEAAPPASEDDCLSDGEPRSERNRLGLRYSMETPFLLRQSAKTLLDAVDHFPEIEQMAYQECLDKSPNLLETESDLVSFLRVEAFHIHAAASRLLRYWTKRREIFGERAFLPVNMTGSGALDAEDIEELKRGFLSILPSESYTDSLGDDDCKRPIIFEDNSVPSANELRRERCRFYMLTLAAQCADRGGVVWVRFAPRPPGSLLLAVMPVAIKCEHVTFSAGCEINTLDLSRQLSLKGFYIHGMPNGRPLTPDFFNTWLGEQLKREQDEQREREQADLRAKEKREEKIAHKAHSNAKFERKEKRHVRRLERKELQCLQNHCAASSEYRIQLEEENGELIDCIRGLNSIISRREQDRQQQVQETNVVINSANEQILAGIRWQIQGGQCGVEVERAQQVANAARLQLQFSELEQLLGRTDLNEAWILMKLLESTGISESSLFSLSPSQQGALRDLITALLPKR